MRKFFWLNLLVVLIVSINLRAPITLIGPLIEEIKIVYNINSAVAGFLTTLPLIVFGFMSFVVAYFSPIRAMLFGMILIFIVEIVRSYVGSVGLFVGSVMLGSGIAIANVLMPSFIKAKFPNEIPKIMGIYSLSLNLSTIIGIFLALPLLNLIGLKNAMAFFGIFGIFAIFVYIPQMKNGRIKRKKKNLNSEVKILSNLTALKITILMGLQSFIFYSIITWLPTIILQNGYEIEFGSNMLLLSQIIAIPMAFLAPFILGKLKDDSQTIYLAILFLMYALGLLCLLLSTNIYVIILACIILGFPMGGAFGIAILFITIKSSNINVSSKLSSISQGFGYLIAAPAPAIIGFLYDYFNSFAPAIILLLIASFILNLFGILTHKSRAI
ncbi:MAG: MFS transporter [Helicobacteraceae bacterium]|nr:MFS transporter [Helicobacteraceae bacterium]